MFQCLAYAIFAEIVVDLFRCHLLVYYYFLYDSE